MVACCYGLTAAALATAAWLRGIAMPEFWLLWIAATWGMQREASILRRSDLPRTAYGVHFTHQVMLGALLLLALIVPQ